MSDKRRVETGYRIPSENYCDQPYVVVTKDGNWLGVLTTGPGLESTPGQHVAATISEDQGRNWSELIDIETASDRMTSWVTAFAVPSGRVYAVYNYESSDEATQHGGWLCFKYSDDCGRTWSADRHRIPMRVTRRDRRNVTGGKEQFFWCIDKPVVIGKGVYLGIPKLHSGVPQTGGESWVIHSANVLTEKDPHRVAWELLPDGDQGVWNSALGDIQEEQNLEILNDGTLYMVLRTEIGVIGYTTSKDDGHTWSTPEPLSYPDGRAIKNPRACPKLWKSTDGRFVLWFHNNGFPGWGNSAVRNPVWVSGGIEKEGRILWSQPEVLLYASDPTVRGMSYPDFIEQDGGIWVSETEKTTARVHEVDRSLLEGMWNEQDESSQTEVVRDGLLYQNVEVLGPGSAFSIPYLPSLQSGGFTVEVVIEPDGDAPGRTVLTSYGVRAQGFQISTAPEGALEMELRDARQRQWLELLDGTDPASGVETRRAWQWRTDGSILVPGKSMHVVFIVDGLAKVVSIVADGTLLDGGKDRIQGWWRLNPWLGDINDAGSCIVGNDFSGRVHLVRIYGRYLRTAEAVGNYRSWRRAQ